MNFLHDAKMFSLKVQDAAKKRFETPPVITPEEVKAELVRIAENVSPLLGKEYTREIMKPVPEAVEAWEVREQLTFPDYQGIKIDGLLALSRSALRDIIFGMAANIDPKYFAIFCSSFRQVNKEASVLILVNTSPNKRVVQLATQFHITLIEYDVKKLEPAFLRSYHPSSLRWILYDRILNLKVGTGVLLHHNIEKIIALDARDSAFQTDPFQLFRKNEGKLFVFGEDQSATIGHCGWNSGWVKDCFGSRALDSIGSRSIICSGVSMGPKEAMRLYIQRMSQILTGKFPNTLFPRCERNGVDQGAHNYLVHAAGEGLNISIMYPNLFPVVNMQSAQSIQPIASQPGMVFMENNPIPAKRFSIVHQFDRSAELQMALARKHVTWVAWGDIKSEWAATEECAAMDFIENADLFRAKCDIGAARVISAATCCEACARKSIELKEKGKSEQCTGFTYTSGVCYMKLCSDSITKQQVEIWRRGNERDRYTMKLNGAVTGFLSRATK